MRQGTLIAICSVLLSGCAARDEGTLLFAPEARPAQTAPAPNLVLGPTAEHARLAEEFAYRANWPSVDLGYRVDDTSYATEVMFDDQVYYDRLGGSFLYGTQSVRTSVLLR